MDQSTGEYVCGFLAGATNVLAGYPFDTVKVVQQGAPYLSSMSSASVAMYLIRNEGFFSLFRGLPAPLLGGAIETGVNYLLFNKALHMLETHNIALNSIQSQFMTNSSDSLTNKQCNVEAIASIGGQQRGCSSGSTDQQISQVSHQQCELTTSLEQEVRFSSKRSWTGTKEIDETKLLNDASIFNIALAAGVAGAGLSTILAPVELIKALQYEGPKVLVRGLGCTFAREIPGNAIYFTMYQVCKRSLSSWPLHYSADAQQTTQNSHNQPVKSYKDYYQKVQNVFECVLAGGVAGMLMWTTVLPIDTIKTQVQVTVCDGNSPILGRIWTTANKIWKTSGFFGFYRGLGPVLVRAFPANAAQWCVWEYSSSILLNNNT